MSKYLSSTPPALSVTTKCNMIPFYSTALHLAILIKYFSILSNYFAKYFGKARQITILYGLTKLILQVILVNDK